MQKEASVSFRDRNRKQTLLYISVTSPTYFPWGQGLQTPSPALDPDLPELLGGHSLTELSLVDTEPGGHAQPCWSPGQGPQPQSGCQWPSAAHCSMWGGDGPSTVPKRALYPSPPRPGKEATRQPCSALPDVSTATAASFERKGYTRVPVCPGFSAGQAGALASRVRGLLARPRV